VTITSGKNNPLTTSIICLYGLGPETAAAISKILTVDGIPVADMIDPWTDSDSSGSLDVKLRPGRWRLRCRCVGNLDEGVSKSITFDYNILPTTDPPDFFEDGGNRSLCFSPASPKPITNHLF